uniref:NACHT domain-containing protein n=1 Tax=Sinocyclocheilus anshuiensis TaxID=1608454 RepID=A0A671Q5U2_9TELE
SFRIQQKESRCQCIFEGNEEHSGPSLLNNIYTELYITDGGSSEHTSEHEIRQIETASKHPATWDAPIKANDIFKASPESAKQIRTVLTKGIAGIGKTVSVQKFTLDWVEERANQDVCMIFPLPFREMNGIKEKKISLIHILECFFNLKTNPEVLHSNKYKVVFILDGLDECRFPLDFQNHRSCSSVTESVSVGVLLTNLICKNLLPSALVWITSRPAAAGQIPPDLIDRVTEVRGFNDSHKEEYFKKKISDPDLSSRIISQLKSSKVLHIMCHIPVFCWISATVLERIFRDSESGEIPKTLTQMYTHFLMFQIKHGSHKYDDNSKARLKWDNQTTLLLGKLAFQQLEMGNLLFYEEDLRECGIELDVALVYSGVCTQIFREESGLLQERVFSFIHASIQEFLAALYAFLMFVNYKRNVLSQTTNAKIISTFKKTPMHAFLKCAVDNALANKGCSGLASVLSSSLSCLRELDLTSNNLQDAGVKQLAAGLGNPQCKLETLRLMACELTRKSCAALAQALQSTSTSLKHLDLSLNDLQDSGVELLCSGLKSPSCKLETLSLSDCKITANGCSALSPALKSNPSHMRELDLSINNLTDSGVKHLILHCFCAFLRLNNCNLTHESCRMMGYVSKAEHSGLRELNLSANAILDSGLKQLSVALRHLLSGLQSLSVTYCGLTADGCAVLASALSSNQTQLKALDLRGNKLTDSGVKLLSHLLEDPQSKLEEFE